MNTGFSFGTSDMVDSLDSLRLEYNKLLQENQADLKSLASYDDVNFKSHKKGEGKYAFFCYLIPYKLEEGNYSDEYGTRKWYLYNFKDGSLLHDRAAIKEIHEIIKSDKKEERFQAISDSDYKMAGEHSLMHVRNELDSGHIDQTKLKLLCSMTIWNGTN